MRSMLPILKARAQSLRDRVQGSDATLELLRDLNMAKQSHVSENRLLHARLASIETDIHILEQGYALKETRNGSR